MNPCKHCSMRRGTRPRGLCATCYLIRSVRLRYPISQEAAACRAREDPPPRRAPRKLGEPPWRCLWCMRFRCQRPLDLCPECQTWYEIRSVGMPGRTA